MSTAVQPIAKKFDGVSQHIALCATVFFSSACLGSFIGLQLDLYLDVACAVRGSCYGNEGIIFYTSLVHPLVLKLFFSSAVLMLLSTFLILSKPFKDMQLAGLFSENAVHQIKNLGVILLMVGGGLLALSVLFMAYFIRV